MDKRSEKDGGSRAIMRGFCRPSLPPFLPPSLLTCSSCSFLPSGSWGLVLVGRPVTLERE